MTNELNDLVPAQEKLEWVTPKISLMEAGETHGKDFSLIETTSTTNQIKYISGPS